MMSDDLIPLEPRMVAPKLPGKVVLRDTGDDAIDALAADMLVQAIQCSRQIGDFQLALSGGSTPLPLYRRPMYDPTYRQLPWGRTHLWMVDDRRVPMDDERSNYRQIEELIVQHSGIPVEQAHPMEVLEPDADTRYERRLREVLKRRGAGHERLDFVVLGMGGDAHTASLFPHSPALLAEANPPEGSRGALVRINAGPRVTPPDRVTMTLEAINAARFVAVLVIGESKRKTLEKVSAAYVANGASGELPVEELPILGVRPRAGELRWYMDAEACPR